MSTEARRGGSIATAMHGVAAAARLDSLPFDVVLEVLDFLSPAEWTSMAACCRALRDSLSNSAVLWKPPPGVSVAAHKAGLRDAVSVLKNIHRAAVQVTLLRGHTGRVLDVGLSPCGTEVFSASCDGTARVWRLKSRNGAVLAGHGGWVTSIALVQAAGVAETAGDVMPRGDASGRKVALLATASVDKTVRLWRVPGRGDASEVATLRGHRAAVLSVRVAEGGARGPLLLSASSDESARVWSVRGQRVLFTLGGHTGSVESVRHNDVEGLGCADLVATRAAADSIVRVWSLEDGDLLGTCVMPEDCFSIAWASRRELLVAYGRSLALWSLDGEADASDDGSDISELQDDTEPRGGAMAAPADARGGAPLAAPAPSSGRIVHIWRAASRDAMAQQVRVAGRARDCAIVLVNAGDSAEVMLASLVPPYRRLRRIATSKVHVNRIAVNDDGQLVLVSDRAGNVSVWPVSADRHVAASTAAPQQPRRPRRAQRRIAAGGAGGEAGRADAGDGVTASGGEPGALVVLRGQHECRRMAWNGRVAVGVSGGDVLSVSNFAFQGRTDGFTGQPRRKATQAWKLVG